MIQQIVLTRDEVCDLIASVLQYNKKRAVQFRFSFLEDGATIMKDFVCEVSCESDPIRVRVTPEDQDALNSAMDSAARMIEQWQKQRRTTNDRAPQTTRS